MGWILWLIVVASLPDLDYVVKAWHSSNNQGLRITHSLLFSAIAPGLTIILLFLGKMKGKQLVWRGFQVTLASLSHLLLDLFVGVTPLPLFWPLKVLPVKLSFGILPSAGNIDWNNYYFYRNLKLELGVLLPVFGFVCLWRDRNIKLGCRSNLTGNSIKIFFSVLLSFCCVYFIRLNLALPR